MHNMDSNKTAGEEARRQLHKMKEAVTKVIDTLTQEDFHGAFQKLKERYTKYIGSGGDYVEWD